MRTIILALLISSAAAFGIACGSSSEGNGNDRSSTADAGDAGEGYWVATQ